MLRLLSTLCAALSLGVISACFNAPAEDVLFACASGAEPACPAGYTCERDGCCHKDGSDVDATLGACALGIGGESSDSGGPAEESTDGGTSDAG